MILEGKAKKALTFFGRFIYLYSQLRESPVGIGKVLAVIENHKLNYIFTILLST